MSHEILLLILGAALAGLVQGLSGFAFGMVSMSVWVWGLEPQLAAVMAVFGGLVGQVFALFTLRRGPQWALLLPYLAGGLLGVPLGVWALPHLDPVRFKLMLGLFLMAVCPAMLLAHRLPRPRAGRLADGLVGALGGVMGGLGGFSGALPSLWITLRDYDKDLQRGLIQNFSLAMLIATMLAYVAAGTVTAAMWPKMLIVAPTLLLPSLIGSRLYLGLSPLAFRRVVLLLLSCAGATMTASALRALMGL